MPNTIEQLYARKSVRVYTEQDISQEDKDTILQAAMQAPTAGNMMLYSILDITDQVIKDKLAVTCDDQPFIAKAPLVLIFAADYARWYHAYSLATRGQARKPGPGDMMLACSDALIAAQNAVVAAEALGLGSCYIGDILEQAETHRELLHLPEYVLPIGMLCIGHPTRQQQDRKKPRRFAREHIVFENGYSEMDDAMFQEGFVRYFAANGQADTAFDSAVAAVCRRKYDSAFSREMNRSVKVYLDQWETL